MLLRDLDAKNLNYDVILLQTPSTHLSMFIQDRVKRRYKINQESTIIVETKTDYKKIKDVLGTTPPFSDKWFIEINLDKLNGDNLISLIKQSSTCLFFCTCSKYGTFKKFKESFKDNTTAIADFYINYLRRPDFVYLYDAFILSDNKLNTQLFNYFVQSYASDIEAVFELLFYMNKGGVVNSRKTITEICGLGGLSIESFIFTLLKSLSGSSKGLDSVIKNRIKAGLDLGESTGFSSMYNFMSKSLFLFCELKMLMMSGAVYKNVRQLPKSFDEKALARYQKYIWRLKQIPMSDFLRLRQCMGEKVWKTDTDFICFIYRYYTLRAKIVLEEKVRNKNVDNLQS